MSLTSLYRNFYFHSFLFKFRSFKSLFYVCLPPFSRGSNNFKEGLSDLKPPLYLTFLCDPTRNQSPPMQCNASDSHCQSLQILITTEEEEEEEGGVQNASQISISISQMMNMDIHVKMKMNIFFLSLRCLLLIPTHNTQETPAFMS